MSDFVTVKTHWILHKEERKITKVSSFGLVGIGKTNEGSFIMYIRFNGELHAISETAGKCEESARKVTAFLDNEEEPKLTVTDDFIAFRALYTFFGKVEKKGRQVCFVPKT